MLKIYFLHKIFQNSYIFRSALFIFRNLLNIDKSGFGGLEVTCWPLVPKFAGSNPAEAVGFSGQKKNPQHAFLRKGSKDVCLMS